MDKLTLLDVNKPKVVQETLNEVIDFVNEGISEVTAETLGLGNVDNTRDLDKPVSNPQRTFIETRDAQTLTSAQNFATNAVATETSRAMGVEAGLNTRLQAQEALGQNVLDSAQLPQWNATTYTLSFVSNAGATLEVDLPIELLKQPFDFDETTSELVFTSENGQEKRVSLASVIKIYTGGTNGVTQVMVNYDEGIGSYVITTNILDGVISLAKLNQDLQNLIGSKALQADLISEIQNRELAIQEKQQQISELNEQLTAVATSLTAEISAREQAINDKQTQIVELNQSLTAISNDVETLNVTVFGAEDNPFDNGMVGKVNDNANAINANADKFEADQTRQDTNIAIAKHRINSLDELMQEFVDRFSGDDAIPSWQALLDGYATWQAVEDGFLSWVIILLGTFDLEDVMTQITSLWQAVNITRQRTTTPLVWENLPTGVAILQAGYLITDTISNGVILKQVVFNGIIVVSVDGTNISPGDTITMNVPLIEALNTGENFGNAVIVDGTTDELKPVIFMTNSSSTSIIIPPNISVGTHIVNLGNLILD